MVPFAAGDVLLSRLRPELGKVVHAPSAGVCSPELWVLRPAAGVDGHALACALAAPPAIAAVAALTLGTGLPRVRWSEVRRLPVALPAPPTLAALRAVSAALSTRRAAGLAAQALLVALGREAGRRPGSVVEGVQEVRDHVAPAALAAGVPCVGLDDLVAGSLALDAPGTSPPPRSGKLAFRQGDLLYGRLRPTRAKVAVAPWAGVCSPDILVLRGPGVPWLAGWLCRPEVPDCLARLARGTRMPRVTFADLATLPEVVPDPASLGEFERLALPLLACIEAVTTVVPAVRAVRAALLAKSFTVP